MNESATYYGEHQAEDAMSVLARWMGQNNRVRVIYHNGTAVDADIYQGIIRIPRMACASGMTQEALMLLRTRVYHEAGHIDETKLPEAEYPTGALHEIWNALEDRRMESVESGKHKGCEIVFRWGTQHFNRKIAEQISTQTVEKKTDAPLWEALVAMSLLVEGVQPAWQIGLKAQDYVDAAYPEFIKVKKCANAKAVLELAKVIYKLLKDVNEEWKKSQPPPPPPTPKGEPQKGEKGDGEPQQGSGEGEGDGEQDGEPQQGGSKDFDDYENEKPGKGKKGEKSDEKDGKPDDGGDGGDKSEGQDAGTGDEDGDEDGAGDKSEGDEKGGKEKGKDQDKGQDKGKDKGKDGAGDDKGDEKGKDKGQDGKDGDGAGKGEDGGDSEGTGEGDKSKDGNGKADDGGADPEGSGEGKGDGAADGDADGDADGAEGGSKGGKGGSEGEGDSKDSKAGEEGEGLPNGDVKPGDVPYKPEDKPPQGGKGDGKDKRDLEDEFDGISRAQAQNEDLEEFFKNMAPEDKRYTSRRDLDIHSSPETKDEDKTSYRERLSQVSVTVASMTRALEQALRSMARCRKNPYLREGKIDHLRLVAIAKGLSKEVFYRTRDGMKLDVAVEITMDESGSMANFYEVQLLAMAIGEALNSIGIPFEIIGTTTAYGGGDRRMPSMDGFTRVNPIIYKHYKLFNEQWVNVRQRMVHSGAYHHNIDGEVVEYAAFRLKQRPESRKVVFSLSDGEPCGGHGNDTDMAVNLKRVCKRVRQQGVEVYGFGIGTESPKTYYGAEWFVALDKVEKMGADFVREFVRIVTMGKVKV